MPTDPLYVKSSYCQVIELSESVIVCGHSFRGNAIPIDREYARILANFATPKTLDSILKDRANRDAGAICDAVKFLLAHGLLVDLSLGDEVSQISSLLRRSILIPATDPNVGERIPRYEVKAARHLHQSLAVKIRVLFYGRCNVQVGMDLLRQMGEEVGIEVEARTSFFDDIAFVEEWKPDFVVIGFLSERHEVLAYPPRANATGDAPPERYETRLRSFVEAIRERSTAPLLILNFPAPTCSPLGVADQGIDSHVNRARRINLGIAAVAGEDGNAFVVDLDAAWGLWGKRHLVDDTFESFSHLGSLSYVRFLGVNPPAVLQPVLPSIDLMPGQDSHPLLADRITAECVLLLIRSILGHSRKKCVVVDLDNTLWPGVLADTGSPFPQDLSYDPFAHGLYIGLHSALRALRDRGFLLAVCSKNDEALVRELWSIPAVLRGYGLLEFEDFVIHRINWREKAENIVDIAHTLNIGLDSIVFVDDNPVEREKVRLQLPQVMVMGDNPFTLRWELLTQAEFQVAAVTREARNRQAAVAGQLQRHRELAAASDPTVFLRELELRCEIEKVAELGSLDRIHELIMRTNQFNTTGRRYTREQVEAMILSGSHNVFTMKAEDRFTNYGLVGACLAKAGVIELLVMSCRVIGLGLESAFLSAVVSHLRMTTPEVGAFFTQTDRNHPSRTLFPSAGFVETSPGVWTLPRGRDADAAPNHIVMQLHGF